jgi:p38 MAP kinase
VPFTTKFPNADPVSLNLLEKMLVFDPRTRISATDGLAHEYLAPYHDPTDEPVAAEVFDWSFNDADLPVDTWKVMMYSDILGEPTLLRPLLIPDFHNLGDMTQNEAEGPVTGDLATATVA